MAYKESSVRAGVTTIELDSWQDFFELTIGRFNLGSAWIYRGQSNYEWPLRSSLDRLRLRYPKRKNLAERPIPEYFDCPPYTESEHLDAFRRALRGRRGTNPPVLGNDELWALGQHHGLATPLLDWTRSPWVALFFAFEEERCIGPKQALVEPEYRGVYMLSTVWIENHGNESDDRIRVLSPDADGHDRLVSQGGVFLRMPQETDLESYVTQHCIEENDCRHAVFIKIRIPNSERDVCLPTLSKMNLNRMTLFPDIGGAAAFVNSLWQPRHEESIAYF